MLPGVIVHLPLVALLAFSNGSQPSSGSAEDADDAHPASPLPLQPPGRWSTAPWGECSNPCGGGEERREVSCVLEDVTGTLIVATDGFCAPPKPAQTRPCYQYRSECVNSWVTGDWGQCSAKCGGGQRSRVVECHAGPGEAPAPSKPLAPLADGECVEVLRPAERRECNLQPCPDGRRVWLRTSDGRKPRRIRLFSKFTLRCPFPVYWTPADDRTKRKYAWYKDGKRLPSHEDKYTQTDSRSELRVKGADEGDSGVYTCASLTANPQGRSHNITVTLQRVPGEPVPSPPPLVPDEDSDGEDSPEAEPEDVPPDPTPVVVEEDAATEPATEAQTTSTPSSAPDVAGETEQTAREPEPSATLPGRRRKRELADADDNSSGTNNAIEAQVVNVVAARYDASPFSECSATCGADGLRHSSVRCVDNESGAQLPLAACEDLGPPPAPQEPCNRVDCPPEWQWQPWSGIRCSHPCGGGTKWRQALCVRRLATGLEEQLGPEQCEAMGLGPGKERKACHRAACRVRVREGEVLKLDCRAANATWRHGTIPLEPLDALNLANGDKYVAINETGTLYVFGASPKDGGVYLCDEEDGDRGKLTHRFEVEVLPSTAPTKVGRLRPGEDDLIHAKCVTAPATLEPTLASTKSTIDDENPASAREVEDERIEENTEDEIEATGPAVPWHLFLTPAAPTRGQVLGIFS